MKKFYLLATALVFSLSANAQLTEGFEDYPLGPYFGGHWTNWSQIDIADENILIVSDYASEGVQAGYIGGNGIQDAILDVGMKQGWIWTYSMDIYIEFFASGYFNAQHDLGSMGTTGNWAYQSYIG
ncbi:MAG: T9SS C-terminal target domain-containing protein, partial [Weeksellaceae bacterium]|nr:T9SS C-terminal target domain-containing protein [Weeksellaceae bacterium]